MRTLKITVALAAIACVVAALASPALAKEVAFFGEFHANVPSGGPVTPSTPVEAKTKEGELGAMFLGGKEETGPFAFTCEKLTSDAKKVEAENSQTFRTEIKFIKCKAQRRLVGHIVEEVPVKMQKGFEMEFHANGLDELGKSEGENHIVKGTQMEIRLKGGACKVILPNQTIPTSGNLEKEAETAEYGKEFEKEEKLKLYPNGFKFELNVFWENKVVFYIPVEKNGSCQYSKEPGGKFNPELNVIEYKGFFEGELEEIKVKKGNIWFESARERKEIEEKGPCAQTHSCV